MNGPQPYLPKMSSWWWIKRSCYIRYMLRELTCVGIGAYCLMLIVGLYRLGQGPEAWGAYLQALASLPGIIFQAVVLALAIYHTTSWFALAPRTMPIRLGGRPVPAGWIHAAHYLVWIALSIGFLIVLGV